MSTVSEKEILYIKLRKIEPNPDNPRRLFDPVDMVSLKKSIDLRGIMVPIIVFRKQVGRDEFVLLDGERRLTCAKQLGLPNVPAREISKPGKTENIIRMFNIHNVRKGWELVPTAYALDKLIILLEKEGKKTSNSELSKLTGMTTVRVSECKRIMKYKQYLYLSLDTNPEKRIGGDFFSQLDIVFDKLKKFPEILDEIPKKKIIDIMIKKKQDGTIDNFIKEFRTLRKVLESQSKGVEKKRIIENVGEYITSKTHRDKSGKTKTKAITADELYERTSSSIYTENEIMKKVKELEKLLSQIKYSKVKNKREFNKILNSLIIRIKKTLSD